MGHPTKRKSKQQPTQPRCWRRWGKMLLLSLLTLVCVLGLTHPSWGQNAFTRQLGQAIPLPTLLNTTSTNLNQETAIGSVYVDGRSLFRISANKNQLNSRIQEIEQNLREVKLDYIQGDISELQVEIRTQESLPTLYINEAYIMTVTHVDAEIRGLELSAYAETVKNEITTALQRAKQERQPEQMWQNAQNASIIGVGVIVLSLLMRWFQKRLQRSPEQLNVTTETPDIANQPQITTQLTQRQKSNLKAIQRLFFNVGQMVIWVVGILLILHLFPQTRGIQVSLRLVLRSYLFVGVVALVTYVLIRLSYIFIDRIIETLVEGAQLMPQRGQRLQQRVSTISGVTKGLTTITLIIIAIFVSLIRIGVDVGPLVAGAGLIGVALSLASQNLIRDAINGFLVLAEDQYAVGDVIVVGDVFGLVENITLRMTQLRDPEARLITIPNSEIKVVCNLSSRYSQADLQIPVAYSADIDKAFAVTERITWELVRDPQWQDKIIGDPQILGLDAFNERGMVIRIWIKTKPLKQWEVAREYRRRIKRAFDQAGIALAVSQQELWVHDNHSQHPFFQSSGNWDKKDQVRYDGSGN
ncbi:mechanosensitive ion channel family protein [Spirulina sp. CS-785/01]|uniref:mechanosensitive ion channel family protein n=1 Tax=Spirulina sp. CS-785/01 TaxID=3021716 RepID=UPI00232C3235|nr:mechanosensitive ion channel family protein [Spirulina sp. CS-785/01]MDB9315879.1 mechanosensitive ion channel family protein [Spirulina sp. CS-785/01]